MKYHLFIDETGNFQKKIRMNRNTNFVAGWICRNIFPMQLDQILNNAVAPHNLDIEKNSGKECCLQVPAHLHFIPLHMEKLRTGADQDIKVPVEKVPPLMQSIFSGLEEKTVFSFRSTGFPRYYANEQAAYIEILRATILQIIGTIECKKEDTLEIIIASRRIKKLLGVFGIQNVTEYERNICNNLRDEISEIFAERSMAGRVSITMKSARKETGLAIADLFCGAMRNGTGDYLEAYRKKGKFKRFSIHKAFVYLSNRTIPKIKHIFSEDPIMGVMLGLEHAARAPQDNALGRAVDAMCRKTDVEDQRLLENELKLYLDEKLVKSSDRYENLDFLDQFIEEIEKRFTGRRIDAIVTQNRIIIACHRGAIDLDQVQKYLDFLDRHGAEIFNGMYNAAQQRLETILFMVQSAAFNVFKFEDVEACLGNEIERYNRIFPLQDDQVDESRARLEGTIGQMYAFLCDYPEGEAYHEDAEQHLQNDIRHCEPHSHFWYQGMGYLTSFYFRRNALEKTNSSLMAETRTPASRAKDVFDLSKALFPDSQQNSFTQLHRLYTCALALHQGGEITGEDVLKTRLLEQRTDIEYPAFLTMKWLGVIYAMKGDLETALALFERSAGNRQTDDFTIEVIKLPIKILIHSCRKKLGKRSRFDLQAELDGLERKVPGISENLERLGIKKYMDHAHGGDWYDIAGVMPFYYA